MGTRENGSNVYPRLCCEKYENVIFLHSTIAIFLTLDLDHGTSSGFCAISYHGSWWYKNCHDANLNGQYHQSASTLVYLPGMELYGMLGMENPTH